MKKLEFIEITSALRAGDVIILKIRAHTFLQARENNIKPLAHCIFLSANREFIEVSFEKTLNPNGYISDGSKLPNRVNYARIEAIEKI